MSITAKAVAICRRQISQNRDCSMISVFLFIRSDAAPALRASAYGLRPACGRTLCSFAAATKSSNKRVVEPDGIEPTT